ncbi:MAG TPA: DUF423 domain-containing protein [Flavobacteriales bacterium]|nr:DUF423 domain-containing protein [Flavobacteriales bacterium]
MISYLRWAGIFGTIAIIILAMSSHLLPKYFTLEQIASINTAAYIQLIHAVVLLALGFHTYPTKYLRIIAKLMSIGVCCFSFSIYLLVFNTISDISFVHFLWPITPIGGILLILSWAMIIINAKNLSFKADKK